MTRKMIINAIDPDEVRIAILEKGKLQDFDIEARGAEKNKGNIYKAVVVAVEPALNAAFVNYGADKQGFLTAHDVDPSLAGLDPDKTYTIDELLKPKQSLLVQITKDEVGSKGAVLTTYLSLAGRYLVLTPDSSRHGVSRKIEDEETRRRVREAAAKLDIPDEMGVIIRTAGKDRTKTDLNRDLKVLLRLWENIKKESEQAKAPALIFKEQDVIIRTLRDYFSTEVDEIILDSDEAYDRAAEYMHMVMPKQRSVLTRYVERRPIFHHYRVEEQLAALYSPRVPLPSGGSLVIQATEALVAIDVNSGKQKSGHQEETAAQTNVEAAHEVARQLRLRDLGGIVVIDFIDMMQRKNQQKVEKALREALRGDKARIKVSRISRNGTLEMTRQRIRTSLEAAVFDQCRVCGGTGSILSPQSHAVNILRRLRDRACRGDLLAARVRVEPQAADLLRTEKWSAVQGLEQTYNIRVDVVPDHALQPGQDDFTFETDPNAVVIELEEPNFGPAPRFEDYDEDDDASDIDDALDEDEDEEDMSDSDGQREGRGRRGSRGRSRRRRSSEAGDRTETMGGDLDLALPTFEMVDPEDLNGGNRRRRSRNRSRSGDDDGRRSRRGGNREGRESREPRESREARDSRGAAREPGDRDEPRRRRRRRRGGERPAGETTAARQESRKPRAESAPSEDTRRRSGVRSLLAKFFGLND